MSVNYGEPSLKECFSDLTRQAGELVREEVELAKTELSQTAGRLGKGAGFVAAGAALGYAALLALIASCIILLALVVKLWIAALIVTGVVALAAGILIMSGINRLKVESLAPRETMQTIQEDVAWLKAQAR
ncbi:MAG TPA: phage holin family protein [Chloroflexota bacterium]|nr:phage holin family protein [Chloroflexota bacterium]